MSEPCAAPNSRSRSRPNSPAADDHRAPRQPAGFRHPEDHPRQQRALDGQRAEAEDEPAGDPDARDDAFQLEEEQRREHHEKGEAPAARQAQQLADGLPEGGQIVGMQ